MPPAPQPFLPASAPLAKATAVGNAQPFFSVTAPSFALQPPPLVPVPRGVPPNAGATKLRATARFRSQKPVVAPTRIPAAVPQQKSCAVAQSGSAPTLPKPGAVPVLPMPGLAKPDVSEKTPSVSKIPSSTAREGPAGRASIPNGDVTVQNGYGKTPEIASSGSSNAPVGIPPKPETSARSCLPPAKRPRSPTVATQLPTKEYGFCDYCAMCTALTERGCCSLFCAQSKSTHFQTAASKMQWTNFSSRWEKSGPVQDPPEPRSDLNLMMELMRHSSRSHNFQGQIGTSDLSPFAELGFRRDAKFGSCCAACGGKDGTLRACNTCILAFHPNCQGHLGGDFETDTSYWVCRACRTSRTEGVYPFMDDCDAEGLSIADTFALLKRKVRGGNAVDYQLHPSLYLPFCDEYGSDWVRCSCCSLVRTVPAEEHLQLHSFLFRCSEATWLPISDRKCQRLGDSKEQEKVARIEAHHALRSRRRTNLLQKGFGEEPVNWPVFSDAISGSKSNVVTLSLNRERLSSVTNGVPLAAVRSARTGCVMDSESLSEALLGFALEHLESELSDEKYRQLEDLIAPRPGMPVDCVLLGCMVAFMTTSPASSDRQTLVERRSGNLQVVKDAWKRRLAKYGSWLEKKSDDSVPWSGTDGVSFDVSRPLGGAASGKEASAVERMVVFLGNCRFSSSHGVEGVEQEFNFETYVDMLIEGVTDRKNVMNPKLMGYFNISKAEDGGIPFAGKLEQRFMRLAVGHMGGAVS